MATTPNMTLTTWPSADDHFSSTALVTNFEKLDAHDHTTGKGVQIPVGGLAANAVNSAAISSSAVTTAKVQDGAITAAKIASAVSANTYGTVTYGTIASAANIDVASYSAVEITGTTNITSITAGTAGRRVTLIFRGALTFTDGSNLKLAGNFVTTADDTITLVSDGTSWYETSRSVN